MTIEEHAKQLEEEFLLSNMKYNSKIAKASVIAYSSGSPSLDGHPDLLSRLADTRNVDYSSVTSNASFAFKSSQTLSQEGRTFSKYQIEQKPWYASRLSGSIDNDYQLTSFLFSPLNDLFSRALAPVRLSECLFKACKFSSASADGLSERLERALDRQFRWFYLDLGCESTPSEDVWTVTSASGDTPLALESVIRLITSVCFVQTSMPVVIRLNLDQPDFVVEKLQRLAEDLLVTFGIQVVVTPGFVETLEVEKLRNKVRTV